MAILHEEVEHEAWCCEYLGEGLAHRNITWSWTEGLLPIHCDDARSGENYCPGNVYPEDLPHFQEQLRPFRTYDVELRGCEVWVNLD